MIAVELERLGKHLGGRWILEDVSIGWGGRGVLALCGVNGSGKSTLLRLLAGMIVPDTGDVRLGGNSLRTERAHALQHIGYAPGVSALPTHLTVRETLDLLGVLRNQDSFDKECLDTLALVPLLDERCGTLSLGQRRRVTLAIARIARPSIVLLDEPTNGLDAHAQELFHSWVQAHVQSGGGVIVATHDVEFIQRCATERWDIVARGIVPTDIAAPARE